MGKNINLSNERMKIFNGNEERGNWICNFMETIIVFLFTFEVLLH